MDHNLLNNICSSDSVSSFEKEVSDVIKKQINTYSHLRVIQDNIGGLIVGNKDIKSGINIMFASHMDEVGFIVEKIEKNFLKLKNIGSLWTHLVVGQLYNLTNKNGKKFTGVISSPSSHAMPEKLREKTLAQKEIYLDLGMTQKEIEENDISIGDMCTPFNNFMHSYNGEYIISKALDDRIGCYIGIETLKISEKNDSNLFWAFTVQEEPGLRGARAVTNLVKPDLAFAIDTTLAGDTPFDDNIVSMGKGVVLSCIDSNSLAHRGLLTWIEKLCEQHDVKYQLSVFNKGGTDSGNIHKCLNGVINMTLAIPIRYMHSSYSMVHKNDVECCLKLIRIILKNLTKLEYRKIKG